MCAFICKISPLTVVVYLQKLFTQMIFSNDDSITPEKRIAEMTLFDARNTFGQQQDVSECMDAIMDMFDIALSKHKDFFHS